MSALKFGWRYLVGSELPLFEANRLLSSKGRKVELLGELEELLYANFPCNRNPRSLSLIFISFRHILEKRGGNLACKQEVSQSLYQRVARLAGSGLSLTLSLRAFAACLSMLEPVTMHPSCRAWPMKTPSISVIRPRNTFQF